MVSFYNNILSSTHMEVKAMNLRGNGIAVDPYKDFS